MKYLLAGLIVCLSSLVSVSQDNAQKIYDTERAFEKMVAEKGINAGFIEYLSPVGVMFFPEPANAREVYSKRPPSPAALTWNPIRIETSWNGALAYSIGNSIYKPKGKDDITEYYGHYLSVWARQPNGEYRAALDIGINHPKPASVEPDWRPGASITSETSAKGSFAGDSSIGFYRMAEDRDFARAYKSYAADDIFMMREGRLPIVGRNAAADYIGDQKLTVKFVKRRSFIEAGDLAYVYSGYMLFDKKGVEKEKGSYVQVWKLRGGRWLIAADVFVPIPPPKT
jgi:ketosteroid isomerase-like protein